MIEPLITIPQPYELWIATIVSTAEGAALGETGRVVYWVVDPEPDPDGTEDAAPVVAWLGSATRSGPTFVVGVCRADPQDQYCLAGSAREAQALAEAHARESTDHNQPAPEWPTSEIGSADASTAA